MNQEQVNRVTAGTKQIKVVLQHYIVHTDVDSETTRHFTIDFDDSLMLVINKHIAEFINRFHEIEPILPDWKLTKMAPMERTGREISTELIFNVI